MKKFEKRDLVNKVYGITSHSFCAKDYDSCLACLTCGHLWSARKHFPDFVETFRNGDLSKPEDVCARVVSAVLEILTLRVQVWLCPLSWRYFVGRPYFNLSGMVVNIQLVNYLFLQVTCLRTSWAH